MFIALQLFWASRPFSVISSSIENEILNLFRSTVLGHSSDLFRLMLRSLTGSDGLEWDVDVGQAGVWAPCWAALKRVRRRREGLKERAAWSRAARHHLSTGHSGRARYRRAHKRVNGLKRGGCRAHHTSRKTKSTSSNATQTRNTVERQNKISWILIYKLK